jgi:hypothetical protein
MGGRTTITPLVWANFPLALLVLLVLLAWAGHPLRMTLRHPGTVPDRAAAHAYPAAKVALATGGEPETDCRRRLEQHRTDRRRTTHRPGGRQDDPRASQPASREDYRLRAEAAVGATGASNAVS